MKTYAKAKAEILAYLASQGWALSSPSLKVPYATSPNGEIRLWFKSQAVYFTESGPYWASEVPTVRVAKTGTLDLETEERLDKELA